jgi:RHS repeat-associated protein
MLSSQSLIGPGFATDGNNSPSDTFKRLAIDVASGYCIYWSPNGVYYYFTDSDFTSGNNIMLVSDGATLTRSVNQSTQLFDYKITTSSGYVFDFTAVSGALSDGYTDRMILSTDPSGRVTTYNRDSNGLLTSVVTPEGTIWSYTCEPEYGRITKAVAPDGTYTTVAYNSEANNADCNPAENKVSTITRYDASNNEMDQFQYQYDGTTGNLIQASQGSKVLNYTYSTDASGNSLVTVTETSASPNTLTVYNYGQSGSDTTLVTKKHSTDSSKDETTAYKFFMCAGLRSYEYSRTTADSGTVVWSRYVPTGVSLDSQNQQDCVTNDNPNLYGKAFTITDQLGNQTNYTWDSNTGNLLTVTYADSSTETNSYYPGTSLVLTHKNVRGNYTHYVRDAACPAHVTAVKVSAPVGGQEPSDWSSVPDIYDYSYYSTSDPHGQGGLVSQTCVPNIDGSTPSTKNYAYFETINGVEKHRAQPTSFTTPYWTAGAYGTATKFTSYDDMGRVTSATDANGKAIQFTYDAYGHRIQTTFAQGVSQQSGYDCCNLLWTQDENGHQNHYAYDNSKRLTTVWTDVSGQSLSTPLITYTYDCFGNLASSTSYSGSSTPRTTTYTYDCNNRLIQTDFQSPLGYEAFGYDVMNNRVWKRDGDGNVTLYRYDNLNRLTDTYYNYTGSLTQPITYPARNADVSYTYDRGSRLVDTITERDSTGSMTVRTSSYTYDVQDRTITYSPPAPSGHGPVSYAYNNLGAKTGVSSDGYNTAYQYFANGTLKSVTYNGRMISSYGYDPVGNETTLTFGNQAWQSYSYGADARYLLSQINYGYACDDVNGVLAPPPGNGGLKIIRDSVGNPAWWGSIDGSYSRIYAYDPVNMLTQETYGSQSPVTDQYDWVGNHLNLPGAQYNSADEMTAQTGHTFSYDGIGNLVSDNLTSYAFTPSNLPASVTVGSQAPSVMTWDASGKRVGFTSSTDPSNPYTFVYDPTARVPSVIEEDYAGSSVYYVRDPSGMLLARVNGPETKYYGFDDLGNTLLLTGEKGTVTDKYSYDAWGNVLSHIGSTQQPYQLGGRFGYYTHYQDAGLAPLVQVGIRLYNPRMGRFIQPDIYVRSGRESAYAYVGDEPTRRVDPSGMDYEDCVKDCADTKRDAHCLANLVGELEVCKQETGNLDKSASPFSGLQICIRNAQDHYQLCVTVSAETYSDCMTYCSNKWHPIPFQPPYFPPTGPPIWKPVPPIPFPPIPPGPPFYSPVPCE